MKTSELSGAALDWAVAKCEGVSDWGFLQFYEGDEEDHEPPEYHYATDWALGGAIIEREGISILSTESGEWCATIGELYYEDDNPRSPTPLVAAMRAYVASKLGKEVQIPEEITP